MSKVRFTVDGRVIEAEADSNLLEVARLNGIDIPSLCHDPRLQPFGACRQCIVEIEGARGLVQACGAKVREGMIVRTNTERIIELRRLGLEFLLTEHSGDCISPCQLACPAGIDIQGFVAHIANGQPREASKLIKEKLPLPASVGRVCPKFCERECRRNLVDGPVSICDLKRFAGDFDLSRDNPYTSPAKPDTGKQVAVIGGGPAGLAAAYFLALEGHRVTILEATAQLGGMMRYGIPEYRLPKDILDKEIKVIADLCQDIFYNKVLGRDFTLRQLKQMGFDAVFVGIGSWANQSLKLPGEDLEGVYSGIQFLRQVAVKQPICLGHQVVIIGGGNVAMDAARTAVRLGTREVTVVYRRSREQMPANSHEIDEAMEEGVKFELLTAPVAFSGEQGRVSAIQCVKMRLGEPDSSGRRRPVPIDGSEFELPADMVIAATGQKLDQSSLLGSEEISLNRRGNIEVDSLTMQGRTDWLFAAGDCVSGPATVVEAIAAGHKAAYSMNQLLLGRPVTSMEKPFNCTRKTSELDPEEYSDRARIPRTSMPTLGPEERKNDFKPFELGFTWEMARREAERCLSCGCQEVFTCRLREYATKLKVNPERLGLGRRTYPVMGEHPDIIRDPNKCVLCGNCVRICQEIEGISALGLVNRGSETVVLPALKTPLTETLCNSCGQCVIACPTGALSFRSHLPKPGPWRTDKVESTCTHCNIGCKLTLNVTGNQIIKVTAPIDSSTVNEGSLCNKGTFGYKFVNSANRLRSPLLLSDGKLVESGWEEAITRAGEFLKEVRDSAGWDSIAVAISPGLTNEENYLAYKLGRMVLGTNKIFGTVPVPTGKIASGISKMGLRPSFKDLLDSDLILMVGGEISLRYPIAAHKIKKAVATGSKLLVIEPHISQLDSLAISTLMVNKSKIYRLFEAFISYVMQYSLVDQEITMTNSSLLDNLKEQISEDFFDIVKSFWVKPSKIVQFLHLYLQAKNPVIVVDGNNLTSEEMELLSQLAFITGNLGQPGRGIIILYPQGNIQGQFDLGVKNDIEDYSSLVEGVKDGSVEGLLILDDGSGLDQELFQDRVKTIVITPYLRKGINADVILPGTTFAETNGSITNCEGNMQQLVAGLPPLAGKKNGQILVELAGYLGFQLNYQDEASIHSELLKHLLQRF